MAVVSIAEWPAAGRPFTVDELDRMPDDGRRYELIDGVLIVSPAPIIAHQFAVMELSFLLKQACPEGLYVLPGPGIMVNIQTELIPDIVVVLTAGPGWSQADRTAGASGGGPVTEHQAL